MADSEMCSVDVSEVERKKRANQQLNVLKTHFPGNRVENMRIDDCVD